MPFSLHLRRGSISHNILLSEGALSTLIVKDSLTFTDVSGKINFGSCAYAEAGEKRNVINIGSKKNMNLDLKIFEKALLYEKFIIAP
jgi:hypothetical protein